MTARSFGRVLRLGLTNFWRNWWLSVASVLVMAVTLFIVGVFAVQTVVILKTTQGIQDKLDLSVYFNDDVPEQTIKDIRTSIANRADVKSVEYVSKEQAFDIFKNRPTSEKIKSLITPENNPLPRSLVIKAHDPAQLSVIAKLFGSDQYTALVRRISYQDNQNVVDTLVHTEATVRRNGIILTIVFIMLSFVLIYNTTRIVIMSRSDEIEIMRLVGATEAFVRWPFIIEAGIYGFLGGVIAFAALFFFLKYDLSSAVPLLSIANFLAPDMQAFFLRYFAPILVVLIVAGMFIAGSMSSFAVRKFVRL
jgi:cell division transport system permease protein